MTAEIEKQVLDAITHHLDGLEAKVREDFSSSAYNDELDQLKSDPVYSRFGLATPEYALVRLMGRISISVGRRLGELYDKIPRAVAGTRFGLSATDIAEKFGNLEIDIALRFSKLSREDRIHIAQVVKDHLNEDISGLQGIGIEIRYNFNPNDSARLRKDKDMARLISDDNLLPIYLVYSSISPRRDAINSLSNSGWHFLQGAPTSSFSRDLLGVDFLEVLDNAETLDEVHKTVRRIFNNIYGSEAFEDVTGRQTRTNS